MLNVSGDNSEGRWRSRSVDSEFICVFLWPGNKWINVDAVSGPAVGHLHFPNKPPGVSSSSKVMIRQQTSRFHYFWLQIWKSLTAYLYPRPRDPCPRPLTPHLKAVVKGVSWAVDLNWPLHFISHIFFKYQLFFNKIFWTVPSVPGDDLVPWFCPEISLFQMFFSVFVWNQTETPVWTDQCWPPDVPAGHSYSLQDQWHLVRLMVRF